jgi:hypothetical protein
VGFEPYSLGPKDQLVIHVCFNPTQFVASSALVTVVGPHNAVLASIGVRGQGRRLQPDELPPMGLMAPAEHFRRMDTGRKRHVEVRDGALIDAETGKDVTPTRNGGIDHRGRPPERRAPMCVVEITGGGEIPNPAVVATGPTSAINTGNLGLNQGVTGDEINVGQHVILDVRITCPDGTSPRPTAVQWTIPGNAIRDYDETLRSGTVTTTALEAADLVVTPRDLFWRDTGTHRVECRVDYTWNAQAMTAIVQRDLVVERNDADIDRQMEDFYVWNHQANVLTSHVAWHDANPSGVCRSAGADFFVFHRQVLGSANGFRSTFGYPAITFWDGTQALPVSPDARHARRAARNIPFGTPSYYTLRGGPRSGCERAAKLTDFGSAASLAREMEAEWHSRGHVFVGGDMRSILSSPKDPIFYRWHRAVDIVYDNWLKGATP